MIPSIPTETSQVIKILSWRVQPNLIAGNWNTENVFLVAADQWGPKTVDGGSGMLTKEGNCSQLAERSTLSFVLRWTSQTTITFSGPWVSAPSLIVISDSDQYFKISYRRFDSKIQRQLRLVRNRIQSHCDWFIQFNTVPSHLWFQFDWSWVDEVQPTDIWLVRATISTQNIL